MVIAMLLHSKRWMRRSTGRSWYVHAGVALAAAVAIGLGAAVPGPGR